MVFEVVVFLLLLLLFQLFFLQLDLLLLFIATSHSLTTPASTSWVTCVLFVAIPMNWEYMCTVSGHYSVLCLWPLLRIVSTCVLFVAITMNSLQCTPPIVFRVWPLL